MHIDFFLGQAPNPDLEGEATPILTDRECVVQEVVR